MRALGLVSAVLALVWPARAQDHVVLGGDVVWIAGGEVTVGATRAELLSALALCAEDSRLTGAEAGCREEVFLPEEPARRVYVATFGIDRREVTNERYRGCVLAGACTPGAAREDDTRIAGSTMPIVGVTHPQAEAYCRFAGGRLPTEEEWEKAARGDSDRVFPWGRAWGEGLANHGAAPFRPDARDGFELMAPVGSFPDGASPFGVLDLAGNVAEWTASRPRSTDFDLLGTTLSGLRVVRGGAFDQPIHALRVTARLPFVLEGEAHGDLGFRCAYDPG